MDWKTLRRDRLAKAATFKPAQPREGAWWGAIDRAGDWWARFLMFSWWEKGLVIGTVVLLAVLAPMAAFAVTGGDGSQAPLIPTSPTATVVIVTGPSATLSPQQSSTPKAVPYTPTTTPTPTPTRTPTSTPVPDREDCDEIRATDYQSPEERRWFLDNCDPEEEPDQEPGPQDTPTPVSQQPTNTPRPEPTISASQAASLAAEWISDNPVFSELIVNAGSCIPQASGDGWRVACTGETTGCVGSGCELTIYVCVRPSSIRQC